MFLYLSARSAGVLLEFIFICDGDGRGERCQAPLLSGEASCEGQNVFVFFPIPQRLRLELLDDKGVHDDVPRFQMCGVCDGEYMFVLECFLPQLFVLST